MGSPHKQNSPFLTTLHKEKARKWKLKINKGQFRLSSKSRELLFNYRRGKGHLFGYILNRLRWHWYPRMHYVSSFPDHVDIEASSACNMHCPMCYTITDEFKRMVACQFMPLELFKKIIDECAEHNIYSIRLSLRGEPFIHKDIIKMIQYACDSGIKEISLLTNGLALTPKLFEEAMKAGLTWLTISVDGVGKMYESIRPPAKFDELVEKIKRFKEIKGKSVQPVLKVQGVWPAVRENLEEYYNTFSPYVDGIASNPLIDYLHRDKEIEYEEGFDCPVLYQRLVIGSDGRVLLCSNDDMGRCIIGDVSKESIFNIWHGGKIQKARDLHGKHMFRKIEPCRECYLPRKLVLNKYIGRTEEIGQ